MVPADGRFTWAVAAVPPVIGKSRGTGSSQYLQLSTTQPVDVIVKRIENNNIAVGSDKHRSEVYHRGPARVGEFRLPGGYVDPHQSKSCSNEQSPGRIECDSLWIRKPDGIAAEGEVLIRDGPDDTIADIANTVRCGFAPVDVALSIEGHSVDVTEVHLQCRGTVRRIASGSSTGDCCDLTVCGQPLELVIAMEIEVTGRVEHTQRGARTETSGPKAGSRQLPALL